MKKHVTTLVAIFIISACAMPVPEESGPADDGGVEILDSGLPNPNTPDASTEPVVDGGSETDAGRVIDAGQPPANDGGFVFPSLDGGLSLPDGGGFGDYQGETEPGVRCGDDLDVCPLEGACCLSFDFTSFSFVNECAADRESTCRAGTYSVGCDDREDCATGQVCCMTGLDQLQPNAACVEAATCDAPSGGDRVCVSEADCTNGEVCCGVTGLSLPVDIGVCRAVCEAF